MYNRWLSSDELYHHGVKDQQWGVRNGPPYPLDRSKSDGHKLLTKGDGSPQGKKRYKTSEKTAHKRAIRKVKTIFVSGSSKTQDESSGYYRKDLPSGIQKQLDNHMKKGNRIIVGDAPGIDRQVQDYLNSKSYENVEIYGPGKEVRYAANPNWKTNPIDDPDHEPGSKEWLAKKDIAMAEVADEGLAVILDEGSRATRNNVKRLYDVGKEVKVYSLGKEGSTSDKWTKAHDVEASIQRERYKETPDNIPDRIRKFLYVKADGRFTKLGMNRYHMGIGDGSLTINDLEIRKRDENAYDERILNDFDFSGLDKKQKAKKEYKLLTLYTKYDGTNASRREEEAHGAIFNRIRNKSIDYYKGLPKTEEQRRYRREYLTAVEETKKKLAAIDKQYPSEIRKIAREWAKVKAGKIDIETYWSRTEEAQEKIEHEKNRIRFDHDVAFDIYKNKAAKAALRDIGYEVNDKNVDALTPYFYYTAVYIH